MRRVASKRVNDVGKFSRRATYVRSNRKVLVTMLKFADVAFGVAEKLGVPHAKDASRIKGFITNYTGDELHNF